MNHHLLSGASWDNISSLGFHSSHHLFSSDCFISYYSHPKHHLGNTWAFCWCLASDLLTKQTERVRVLASPCYIGPGVSSYRVDPCVMLSLISISIAVFYKKSLLPPPHPRAATVVPFSPDFGSLLSGQMERDWRLYFCRPLPAEALAGGRGAAADTHLGGGGGHVFI